mmetsp:Transcript_23242/g.20118  ORF Transcript_23242/g.20118 Transcript_23242/m.20118 type:complete len:301 (+) Transcript_23242:472-1374(+)
MELSSGFVVGIFSGQIFLFSGEFFSSLGDVLFSLGNSFLGGLEVSLGLSEVGLEVGKVALELGKSLVGPDISGFGFRLSDVSQEGLRFSSDVLNQSNDVLDGRLVSEVLGELSEGQNEFAHGGSLKVGELILDLLHGFLGNSDLSQRGLSVKEGSKELKSFTAGSDDGFSFGFLLDEVFVFSLSLGSFSDNSVLSVLDLLLEGGDLVLKGFSSGVKDVVELLLVSVYVNGDFLDENFESLDFQFVSGGLLGEVVVFSSEGFLVGGSEVLEGLNEFFERSAGKHLDFSKIHEHSTSLGFLQ